MKSHFYSPFVVSVLISTLTFPTPLLAKIVEINSCYVLGMDQKGDIAADGENEFISLEAAKTGFVPYGRGSKLSRSSRSSRTDSELPILAFQFKGNDVRGGVVEAVHVRIGNRALIFNEADKTVHRVEYGEFEANIKAVNFQLFPSVEEVSILREAIDRGDFGRKIATCAVAAACEFLDKAGIKPREGMTTSDNRHFFESLLGMTARQGQDVTMTAGFSSKAESRLVGDVYGFDFGIDQVVGRLKVQSERGYKPIRDYKVFKAGEVPPNGPGFLFTSAFLISVSAGTVGLIVLFTKKEQQKDCIDKEGKKIRCRSAD